MYPLLKRAFDMLGALLLLVLVFPLLAVLAIYLVVQTRSWRILFLQKRAGLHGRPFSIIKFRTMTDERDDDGNQLPDGARLKPWGVWMRGKSLDELPQLFNVLAGTMSFIGPRPLPVAYLPLYSAEQARRHELRPGITGWAQINGRNAISWEQKFELDVWYVDRAGFLLDLNILLRTAKKVILAEGISQEGHATMPFFTAKQQA
jgi:sugar transferase EpsL